MQIQVNTDRNVPGRESLAADVSAYVESGLDRYSKQITRVEVHLSDENGKNKEGNEAMRCLLEARIEHRDPIAVSHQATTVAQSVAGAIDKMARKLDHHLGKLREHRRHLLPGQLVGVEPERDLGISSSER